MREILLSPVVDGMDQKKTDCPVMGRFVKAEAPLAQRIIRVKVHGIGNYVYVVDESVSGFKPYLGIFKLNSS